MSTWPPSVDALKLVLKISDARDDARLTFHLAGAVAYVERAHDGWVDFTGELTALELLALGMVPVDDDLVHGTIAYARRLHARDRSPDGMVSSAEFGSVRIGTGDADVDRMLRVGRFARPVIA